MCTNDLLTEEILATKLVKAHLLLAALLELDDEGFERGLQSSFFSCSIVDNSHFRVFNRSISLGRLI